MSATQFKLSIGAKRQVTIPRECMDMLELEEGTDLLLQVAGGKATLTPMVSVPRSALPAALLRKSMSRLGEKPTDLSLDSFLGVLNGSKSGKAAKKSTH